MPGIKSAAENFKIMIKNGIDNGSHVPHNKIKNNLENNERKYCADDEHLKRHTFGTATEKTPGSYTEATDCGENGCDSSCKHIESSNM